LREKYIKEWNHIKTAYKDVFDIEGKPFDSNSEAYKNYLTAVAHFTKCEYALEKGDLLLFGADKRNFEICYFDINGINSYYGEVIAHGFELDDEYFRVQNSIFRIDLIPYQTVKKTTERNFTEEQEKILSKLSSICSETADSKIGKETWKQLYYEIKIVENDFPGWISKSVARSESTRIQFQLPHETKFIEHQLYDLRERASSNLWYSIRLHINRDLELKVDYIEDPNVMQCAKEDDE
jgi:hypothetical protein